ncbi:hypothetical protein BHE74_00008247 [Ensete ventricosum]|nr:hypothetical protein BHE74_00008247 [Ensete ventricosum]
MSQSVRQNQESPVVKEPTAAGEGRSAVKQPAEVAGKKPMDEHPGRRSRRPSMPEIVNCISDCHPSTRGIIDHRSDHRPSTPEFAVKRSLRRNHPREQSPSATRSSFGKERGCRPQHQSQAEHERKQSTRVWESCHVALGEAPKGEASPDMKPLALNILLSLKFPLHDFAQSS